MDCVLRGAPNIDDSLRVAQRGFTKLVYVLILAALAIAVGFVLKYGLSNSGGPTGATGSQSTANEGPREIDFGFVELNPGQPTPITSYKYGGNMVLYAGEELRFQVLGAAPLPTIELRAGDSVQLLPGSDGKLQIAGPAKQPLPVLLVAQGSRLSLPGGAPPRISVKVQVYGGKRPG